MRTKLTKTLSKPTITINNFSSQTDLKTLNTHMSKKSLNNVASLNRFNSVNPIDRDNIFKAEQVIIPENRIEDETDRVTVIQ